MLSLVEMSSQFARETQNLFPLERGSTESFCQQNIHTKVHTEQEELRNNRDEMSREFSG
jgi:hypothetical protein